MFLKSIAPVGNAPKFLWIKPYATEQKYPTESRDIYFSCYFKYLCMKHSMYSILVTRSSHLTKAPELKFPKQILRWEREQNSESSMAKFVEK